MPELSPELEATIIGYAVRAAGVLILLFIVWVGAGAARRSVTRACARAGLDPTLAKFFANMARWLVLLLGVLSCLGVFGIETTSFAGILAGAGIAIGMALSGTLGNFASGVMLLVFRPFRVGQVVQVGGVTGKVNEIELFTTTLDTPDNRRLILPNNEVFGTTIENISHHSERRASVDVGTDYAADIDRTRDVLEQAVKRVPGQLPEREPQVVLTDLGASSVDWQVRVWAAADDFFSVREATIREVKMALDQASIGIPFPQMDVHLDPPAS